MRPDLDSLLAEIEQRLESRGMAVFWSHPREAEGSLAGAVHWDSDNHPDYRDFIETAYAAGGRVVALHALPFKSGVVDTAMARLSQSQLDRHEREQIEERLNEIKGYEGSSCQIEMSFDHAQRTYLFEIRADWFDELDELIQHIQRSGKGERNENPLRALILK